MQIVIKIYEGLNILLHKVLKEINQRLFEPYFTKFEIVYYVSDTTWESCIFEMAWRCST